MKSEFKLEIPIKDEVQPSVVHFTADNDAIAKASAQQEIAKQYANPQIETRWFDGKESVWYATIPNSRIHRAYVDRSAKLERLSMTNNVKENDVKPAADVNPDGDAKTDSVEIKDRKTNLFERVIARNLGQHPPEDEELGLGTIMLEDIRLSVNTTVYEQIALIRWYHMKRNWQQIRDIDVELSQAELNKVCLATEYETAVIKLVGSSLDGLSYRVGGRRSGKHPKAYLRLRFGLVGKDQATRVTNALIENGTLDENCKIPKPQ